VQKVQTLERGTVVCKPCAGLVDIGRKMFRSWWLGNGIGGGRGGDDARMAEGVVVDGRCYWAIAELFGV
jgi:hypothetical protein